MAEATARAMPQREFAQHVFSMLANGLRGDVSDMHGFVDQFTADAELWLPPTPNTRSPYRGRDAIRNLLVEFVLPLYRDGLNLTLYGMLMAPGRVLFQFEDQGTLQDGTIYRNSPCIALGLSGTQITSFHEYWGGPDFFSPNLDPAATGDGIDAAANAIAISAMDELASGLAGDPSALDAFLARLAPDVRMWFPPTPNTRSPYVGTDAASRLFRELLVPMYPGGMQIRRFHALAAGTRTAFELQSYGRRANGSEYINSPCFCVDIRAGKIRRIWEHWGGPGFFAPV
jgi:ketosteroid isomerase-like protein